jgi:hypothetical protein
MLLLQGNNNNNNFSDSIFGHVRVKVCCLHKVLGLDVVLLPV